DFVAGPDFAGGLLVPALLRRRVRIGFALAPLGLGGLVVDDGEGVAFEGDEVDGAGAGPVGSPRQLEAVFDGDDLVRVVPVVPPVKVGADHVLDDVGRFLEVDDPLLFPGGAGLQLPVEVVAGLLDLHGEGADRFDDEQVDVGEDGRPHLAFHAPPVGGFEAGVVAGAHGGRR